MQVLNQQTDTDFFAEPVVHSIELQLAILKEYMTKAANNGVGMHELLAVKEQNDLIKAVKQKLSVTVKKLPSITEPDESDQSKGRLLTETSINKRSIQKEVISSKNRLSTQGSQDIRVRRRQLSLTDVTSILSEIQQKCSRQAYEMMTQMSNEHRLQKERLVNARRDETESNKLTRQNALLRNQIAELHVKIKSQEGLLKERENQIKQVKKALNQRQRSLVKTQTSVLIKDKMLNEHLKSLLTKTESLKKQEQAQKVQREYLDGLWEKIVDKLETSYPDPNSSFKTTILTKCKDSLLKQRNILQQQQEHLDKQHQYIQKIINQLQGVAPEKTELRII